ncbi:MAG TPA: N-acetylmuramidase family protein [Allosphingosinicella sp.]
MTQAIVDDIDDVLDRAGVPRDGPPLNPPAPTPAQVAAAAASPPPPAPPAVPAGRLDIRRLRTFLGLPAAGTFDAATKDALLKRLANTKAAALTQADFARVAADLNVPVKIIQAVRKVEAPRGAFDDLGRPTILYEKHIFGKQTGYAFNRTHPLLSSKSWQPTTYGKFSAQYEKLTQACELDPAAAFEACSWGAFQILGTNATGCGYASAFDMAIALTESEAAHLDCFVRYVRMRGLVDELAKCKPGDPASCVAFVKAYNGPGYAANAYHVKLANAAL